MMNLVSITDKKAVTSSMIVAKIFEKRHQDVLRSVTNLECSAEFRQRNFALIMINIEKPNGSMIEIKDYQITRDGFTFV